MYINKDTHFELCGLCKIEYTLQIQHWYRVSKLRKLAWSTLSVIDQRIQSKKSAISTIQRNYRDYQAREKTKLLEEGDFVLVDVDDL